MVSSQVTTSKAGDIITGFTLFFSCYYVLSANPAILAEVGVPVSAALLGTLLVIIFGNLSGALATNTGLIIAPAIGISGFFASYIGKSDGLTWNQGLWASAAAGLLIVVTSFWSNWRSSIVSEIPKPITVGIKATIGSLLVSTAWSLFQNQQLIDQRNLTVIMGLSICIILGVKALRTHFESKSANDWLITLLSLEYILAVAFVVFALHIWAPEFMAQYHGQTELTLMLANPDFIGTSFTFEQAMSCIPLIATIWFIVITDIPGTPTVVLPKAMREQNANLYETRGYKNDSVFALLSPILGTTPTIYYAENQLLHERQRFGRTIGLTVAALFGLCLIILLASQHSDNFSVSLESIIPPLAVAPVLLYIGMFVIANSFVQSSPEVKQTSDYSFYIPAAIAVVLTPQIGSEYSLPLTILSYWLTGVFKEDEKAKTSFIIISWGAGLVLLVQLGLFLS